MSHLDAPPAGPRRDAPHVPGVSFQAPSPYPSDPAPAPYPSGQATTSYSHVEPTPYPAARPNQGVPGDTSLHGSPSTARRRPGWTGVGAAALAAAVAASLATAALTGAFEPDSQSSSLDSIGRQEISIPVSGSTADNPDWQVIAAAVRDSVVAITVATPNGGGEGSGVVIDAEGLVLTNDHVVGSATGSGMITVTLADGRLYEAALVGTDPTTDIAVVRLVDPPADLTAATLGDSSTVVVGSAVMAVGNPLGLDSTVTTGIVSAVDRPVTTREQGSDSAVVTNAIQVDAAVNPGNSGGPLFNSRGEVIGINSSIATLSGAGASGSIGLGFAIPIDQAELVADQLVESGVAQHAYLGVSLADGTASAEGVTRRGAVVRSVEPGTPAADAGLEGGDVVVGIDGKQVGGAESLTGYVRQHAGGDEVVLTVVRDGEALDVRVALATAASD
jgi:putative serine protease PepD